MSAIEACGPTICLIVALGRRLPHPLFNALAWHFVGKPFKVTKVLEVIGTFAQRH